MMEHVIALKALGLRSAETVDYWKRLARANAERVGAAPDRDQCVRPLGRKFRSRRARIAEEGPGAVRAMGTAERQPRYAARTRVSKLLGHLDSGGHSGGAGARRVRKASGDGAEGTRRHAGMARCGRAAARSGGVEPHDLSPGGVHFGRRHAAAAARLQIAAAAQPELVDFADAARSAALPLLEYWSTLPAPKDQKEMLEHTIANLQRRTPGRGRRRRRFVARQPRSAFWSA